jgi:hypothetical protein
MPGVTLALGVTLPDPPLEGVVRGVGVAPFELLLLHAVSKRAKIIRHKTRRVPVLLIFDNRIGE